MRKLLIALIVIFIPSLTLAATLKTGEGVELNENLRNSYILASSINLDSNLSGDSVMFGQYINVDKNIERDLFAFGEIVDISGNVGGNLRAGAKTLNFSGIAEEDVLAGAGSLNLSTNSNIRGDLWAGAGNMMLSGTVNGNVKITASKVVIDGKISGNVEINAREIKIEDSAEIGGSLTYWSEKEGDISLQAKIAKGPYYNEIKYDYSNTATNITYSLLSLIILALAITYGFSRFSAKIKDINLNSFVKNFGWGLLMIIAIPIACILVFSLSLHLGLAVASAYLLCLVLAYGVSAVYTGAIIQKIISKDKQFNLDWVTVLIGAFIFILVGYIPVIGKIAQMVIYLTSFGYLINKTYGIISSQSAKTKSPK